jgi:hypothetical protein
MGPWRLGLSLALTAACACAACVPPSPAAKSAGSVPCSEDQIVVSDKKTGHQSESWIATCHGRRYLCASHNDGKGVQTACSADDESTQ